jgi:hypothetical protein
VAWKLDKSYTATPFFKWEIEMKTHTSTRPNPLAFGLSTVFAVCAGAALLASVGSAFAQIDPNIKIDLSASVPVGEISGVGASKSLVKVGEAVTLALYGAVQAGKSCQIYINPGYVSNSDLDAGLVNVFPKLASNIPIKFSKPGTYTIRAYSIPTTAGVNSEHYCSYWTVLSSRRDSVSFFDQPQG